MKVAKITPIFLAEKTSSSLTASHLQLRFKNTKDPKIKYAKPRQTQRAAALRAASSHHFAKRRPDGAKHRALRRPPGGHGPATTARLLPSPSPPPSRAHRAPPCPGRSAGPSARPPPPAKSSCATPAPPRPRTMERPHPRPPRSSRRPAPPQPGPAAPPQGPRRRLQAPLGPRRSRAAPQAARRGQARPGNHGGSPFFTAPPGSLSPRQPPASLTAPGRAPPRPGTKSSGCRLVPCYGDSTLQDGGFLLPPVRPPPPGRAGQGGTAPPRAHAHARTHACARARAPGGGGEAGSRGHVTARLWWPGPAAGRRPRPRVARGARCVCFFITLLITNKVSLFQPTTFTRPTGGRVVAVFGRIAPKWSPASNKALSLDTENGSGRLLAVIPSFNFKGIHYFCHSTIISIRPGVIRHSCLLLLDNKPHY